jgi:putative endonuclease
MSNGDAAEMSSKLYWVYILLCSNDTYYTGYTTDLDKRYAAHLNGTASKYTRSFKPVKIIQSWEIAGDKSLAMRIEKNIKQLSRVEKDKIIANPSLLEALM